MDLPLILQPCLEAVFDNGLIVLCSCSNWLQTGCTLQLIFLCVYVGAGTFWLYFRCGTFVAVLSLRYFRCGTVFSLWYFLSLFV